MVHQYGGQNFFSQIWSRDRKHSIRVGGIRPHEKLP